MIQDYYYKEFIKLKREKMDTFKKQDEKRLKELLGVFCTDTYSELIQILRRDQERYHREQSQLKQLHSKEEVKKLDDKLILVFKNGDGDKKELEITFKDLLDRNIKDYYDDLEDECTSSSCNNESQNFCDCGLQYEDYEISEVVLPSLTLGEDKEYLIGQLVKSKLPQHDKLTTWRILEETTGEKTGKKRYFCEAAHDTKSSHGFDSIQHEFNEFEIEEL